MIWREERKGDTRCGGKNVTFREGGQAMLHCESDVWEIVLE